MYALMNTLSNGNVVSGPVGSSSNVMGASNMHALHAHSNMMNGNSFMNNMNLAMNPMHTMSALNTSQAKSNMASMSASNMIPTHQNLHVHQSPMSSHHNLNNMMQQVNHNLNNNSVNLSTANVAGNSLVNDVAEEDLPLPKFHEVFAFAMHKNGLKRSLHGAGKPGTMAFDINKRGKMDHTPGEETSGRWTPEEHRLFLEGVMLYGKDWKKMQPLIKTRSLVQIRTHAQKVFKKIGLKKFDAQSMRQFGQTQHNELASIASSLASSIAHSSSSSSSNSNDVILSSSGAGDEGEDEEDSLTAKNTSLNEKIGSSSSVDKMGDNSASLLKATSSSSSGPLSLLQPNIATTSTTKQSSIPSTPISASTTPSLLAFAEKHNSISTSTTTMKDSNNSLPPLLSASTPSLLSNLSRIAPVGGTTTMLLNADSIPSLTRHVDVQSLLSKTPSAAQIQSLAPPPSMGMINSNSSSNAVQGSSQVVLPQPSTTVSQEAASTSTNLNTKTASLNNNTNHNTTNPTMNSSINAREEDEEEDHDQDHDYIRYLQGIILGAQGDEEGQDIVNQTLAGGYPHVQQSHLPMLPQSNAVTNHLITSMLFPNSHPTAINSAHYHQVYGNVNQNMLHHRNSAPNATNDLDARRQQSINNNQTHHNEAEDEDERDTLFALANFNDSSEDEGEGEDSNTPSSSNNNVEGSKDPKPQAMSNSHEEEDDEDDDDHFQIIRALHSIANEDGNAYD